MIQLVIMFFMIMLVYQKKLLPVIAYKFLDRDLLLVNIVLPKTVLRKLPKDHAKERLHASSQAAHSPNRLCQESGTACMCCLRGKIQGKKVKSLTTA